MFFTDLLISNFLILSYIFSNGFSNLVQVNMMYFLFYTT